MFWVRALHMPWVERTFERGDAHGMVGGCLPNKRTSGVVVVVPIGRRGNENLRLRRQKVILIFFGAFL